MSGRLSRNRSTRIAACLIAALAAGCGGGGDEAPPPPQLLQITTGNQVAVAQAVAVDFGVLDSTPDLPVASLLAATRTGAAEAPVKRALEATIAAAGRAMPMGTTSITESCPSGGSVTITVDDRDNNATPSAGDLLTTAFSDCRETPTSLLTGSFALSLSSYTPTQTSGLLTFSELRLVDEDGTLSFNGPANILYSETTDAGTYTDRIEMTVAGGGLVVAFSSPRYTDTLNHEPGFNGIWTGVYPASPSEGYDTAALRGTVGFASLGGKVILATDPPIKDLATEDRPSSGTVLVTGYQSKLRMTVLNATTVRLELDANNDGTYESALDVPWSEVLPF
jgi:hypothetical protein